MPKRSRKDPNETAHAAVLAATDDLTGQEILAELISSLREGIDEGATDEDLALRLWPRLERVVLAIMAEDREALHVGLQQWREARHANPAAELGRKGGRKGGRARADKLSPKERSDIARRAAAARWGRTKDE